MIEATSRTFTFEQLDKIWDRCRKEEYTCFMYFRSGEVDCTLEKGSTYGKMHMKFQAIAPTASEAFEKCLANFPANPVGAAWDTKRIAPPDVEDGEFNEVPPPAPTVNSDDIPF